MQFRSVVRRRLPYLTQVAIATDKPVVHPLISLRAEVAALFANNV